MNITKTACTLLPYSILDLIKVDTTYLRTVILTASSHPPSRNHQLIRKLLMKFQFGFIYGNESNFNWIINCWICLMDCGWMACLRRLRNRAIHFFNPESFIKSNWNSLTEMNWSWIDDWIPGFEMRLPVSSLVR